MPPSRRSRSPGRPLGPLSTLLTLLFYISTLTHLSAATATAITTVSPTPTPQWSFTAYSDPNCQNQILHIQGNAEHPCTDTLQQRQLQSYRFSATTDVLTNETFSVRLYDREECLYLSMIHEEGEGEGGQGGCRGWVFRSWNVFGFER